jgi:hypothetical protein
MNFKNEKNKRMLTIQNFERLSGEMVGEWVINQATTDDEVRQGMGGRYVLTLRRSAIGDGAAVFISRNEGDKGMYSVKIMYESWDNEIYTNNYMKEQIERKDAFLGMVLHKIDTEYYRRKKVKP